MHPMLKKTVFFSALLLSTHFAMVACSNGGGSSSSASAIPDSIAFDEKSLQSIPTTAEDVEVAKKLLQRIDLAFKLDDQVMVDPNESYEEKVKREQEFQKLSPEVKSLIQNLRQNCQAPKKIQDMSNLSAPPQSGKSYPIAIEQQTTGSACPVSFSSQVLGQIFVESLNQNAKQFKANVSGRGAMKMLMSQSDQMKVVGLSQARVELKSLSGKFNMNDKDLKIFMTVDGGLKLNLVPTLLSPLAGDVTGTLNVKSLVKSEQQHGLISFKFNFAGKSYILTAVSKSQKSSFAAKDVKYFIGSVQLTQQEVNELGSLDFFKLENGFSF